MLDELRETTAAAAKRGLALMTLLGTVDGTILMLAATGRLESIHDAILVGLTVLSGAGAWSLAQQAFQEKKLADYGWLAGLAVLSIVAAGISAWAGATLAQTLTLHLLPKAGGLVLLLVALEVGGVRLPKLARLPLAVWVLVAGIGLEVAWMS